MSNSLSRRSIFRTAGGAVLALLGRLWARPGVSAVVADANQGLGIGNGIATPPLTALNPLGRRFTFTYSASGKLLSEIDPSGKMTIYDWPPRSQDRRDQPELRDNPHDKTQQVERGMPETNVPTVAFGPTMPGWGSWQWAGHDIRQELAEYFQTTSFDAKEIPESDVAVFVKFAPPLDLMEAVARRATVIYAPVDYYGSPGEIDADAKMLRKCSRILIHCEHLRKYFEPYAPVEYMDHHVKFVGIRGQGSGFRVQVPESRDYILWVGVRTNLPALVDWVNEHRLPFPLRVLTNPETPGCMPTPAEFGFVAHVDVQIEEWSPERQLELTAGARVAIDIKGDDFRSRHKPPAKAIDFIASGVPLAMNPDSSPVEHLARMGFEVASPLDSDRWLSQEYWEETCRFGSALRELHSRRRVGLRYKRIIEEVLAERRKP